MFFRRETALKLLTAIQEHVKPGGRAIVNVLIEGTTYLGMFDPDNYCLFRRNELEERFDIGHPGIAHPDVPCSRGHAQGFFDPNRRSQVKRTEANIVAGW